MFLLWKEGVGLWEKATLQTFMIDPSMAQGQGLGTRQAEDRGTGLSWYMRTLSTPPLTHTHTHIHLSHSVVFAPVAPDADFQ